MKCEQDHHPARQIHAHLLLISTSERRLLVKSRCNVLFANALFQLGHFVNSNYRNAQIGLKMSKNLLRNDTDDRASSLESLSEALTSTIIKPLKPIETPTEQTTQKPVEHQGIITVKSQRLESVQSVPSLVDPDLEALNELPRFEPLITTTVRQPSGFFSNVTRQDVVPCTCRWKLSAN